MNLRKYDVIEAKIAIESGSVQHCKERRPYIIVGNDIGTQASPVIIVMPLTHVIKRLKLPVHGCIRAKTENGLDTYSMILGEQPCTISKGEVIRKRGTVLDQDDRDTVNRVTYWSFFWGEEINWKEVLSNEKSRGKGENKFISNEYAGEGMCGHGGSNTRKVYTNIKRNKCGVN